MKATITACPEALTQLLNLKCKHKAELQNKTLVIRLVPYMTWPQYNLHKKQVKYQIRQTIKLHKAQTHSCDLASHTAATERGSPPHGGNIISEALRVNFLQGELLQIQTHASTRGFETTQKNSSHRESWINCGSQRRQCRVITQGRSDKAMFARPQSLSLPASLAINSNFSQGL